MWSLLTLGMLSLNTLAEQTKTKIPASGIDHLLYASATLQRGMDDIEALLGIRPVPGGRHPRYGTHNALLSLGSGVYLEIIARDPQLPRPKQGLLVDIPAEEQSRLITWAYRAEDIDSLASDPLLTALGIGAVESGSREKPDGSLLRWQLSDPYALPLDGAVPFLINWGNTPHPSSAVPAAGELVELVITSPEADSLKNALIRLGTNVRVEPGKIFSMKAILRTENGLVTLR